MIKHENIIFDAHSVGIVLSTLILGSYGINYSTVYNTLYQ